MEPVWELPLPKSGMLINLDNGRRVRIRPVRPTDGPTLEGVYERMSEQSRYLRFFSARSKMGDRLVSQLTNIDHENHFAWLVCDPDEPSEVDDDSGLAVGAARLIRDEDPTSAEAALGLVDDYQRQGIGRFLIELLISTASDLGLETLRFETLRSNRGMVALMVKMGATSKAVDRSVVEFRVPVPAPGSASMPTGALYDLLRHVAE